LKLDYRISPAGNSGINYRSTVVPDPVAPENRFAMRGYQFDIDGRNRYVGNNYEEKGRLFLALRGQITVWSATAFPCSSPPRPTPWTWGHSSPTTGTRCTIIARGHLLMHLLNGRLILTLSRPVDSQHSRCRGTRPRIVPPS
jgi:hypothetical protein